MRIHYRGWNSIKKERGIKNMGFAEEYSKFNTIFDIDIKDFEFMDG